jgi:hypothetical protein
VGNVRIIPAVLDNRAGYALATFLSLAAVYLKGNIAAHRQVNGDFTHLMPNEQRVNGRLGRRRRTGAGGITRAKLPATDGLPAVIAFRAFFYFGIFGHQVCL